MTPGRCTVRPQSQISEIGGCKIMGSANYWGNLDMGSLTQAAKSGHGQASEDASSSASRHISRTLATERLNVGPQGNAQRAGHSPLAAAKQANASNVTQVGEGINQGERVQAQTTDETASLSKVSASEGEAT